MSDRARFMDGLSPDLKPVFESAEKFTDEGLHHRALALYKKLEGYMLNDPYLRKLVRDTERRLLTERGPVSEGTSTEQFNHALFGEGLVAKELANDLGLNEATLQSYTDIPELSSLAKNLSTLPNKDVILDVSVFSGIAGDWKTALELVDQLLKAGRESPRYYLWRLRCLVSLDEYAEAVALFTSRKWESSVLIHANYFAGLAYEGLGIRKQAKQRFQAVYNRDSEYRDVHARLLNY